MMGRDWRWKIGEAIDRIRTRYAHIGRATGAPFLGVVYAPEQEPAVLSEWHTQIKLLKPDFDVCSVNVLDVTQKVVVDLGAENIVDSMSDPMPGSDPATELGHLWITAVVQASQEALGRSSSGHPVVSLEKMAAIHPAAGPHDVMQALWDNQRASFDGPVVMLIPGRSTGPRTYDFLGVKPEFMYRGDLL